MSAKANLIPLVVIVGETATGKSKLALDLARKLDGEIICADSWTVRQELNIGTDKPSKKHQTEIRHHLIDIVKPCAEFTVALFKDLVNQTIEDINSKGKLPIMVGGSGLYVDSVIFDYRFLEPSEPNLRLALNDLSAEELIQKIADLNLSLSNIDQRNKRRLIRHIESKGKYPSKSDLRGNTLIVGLKLKPAELKESIEKRVNQMISKGLEDEVRTLKDKYGWNCEALKGVGYKQWWAYFENHQSFEETRTQIISATNNLAKKQRTWFKRNKSIHWFYQPVKIDEIVDLVTTQLSI